MPAVNRNHEETTLDAIVRKHAARIRISFNRCHRSSRDLADELLREGYPARVIRCSFLKPYAPDAHPKWRELGSQMYWVHYVVRVDDTVYDLTRRQFFPLSPKPFVQTQAAFESEWEETGIDWAWHRDNGLLDDENDISATVDETRRHLTTTASTSTAAHEEAKPFPATEVVYHNTPRDNRESILTHGLALRFSETSELVDDEECEAGAIFFSTKRLIEDERFDTWEVSVSDLPDLVPDETTEPSDPDDTWWMVYRCVPKEVLKLAEADFNQDIECPTP